MSRDHRETHARGSAPRRRRAWIALAILAAAALVAIGVGTRIDGWARARLERVLAERLGGSVRIGALELDLLRLEGRFADLAIAIPAPGTEPLSVRVRAGRVRLGWSGLPALAGGRIDLAALELEAPEIECDRAFWDAAGAGARPGPLDLRVGDLVVADGSLRFSERETRFELRAGAVELRAGWDPVRRGVAGTAAARVRIERPPLAAPISIALGGEFVWRHHEVELAHVAAEGEGLRVALDGTISLIDGVSAVLRGTLTADLARLAGALGLETNALGGTIEGSFASEVGAAEPELRVRGASALLRLGQIEATDASFELRATPDRLQVQSFSARTLGGELTCQVDLAFATGLPLRASFAGRDLAAPALVELLGLGLPFASSVDAAGTIEGDARDPASWNVAGRFAARAPPDDRAGVPIGGDGSFTLQERALHVEARAEAGGARLATVLRADLREPRPRGELRIEGETSDAARTQAATLRVLDALGVDLPAPLREPLAGHGHVAARVALGAAVGQVEVALDLSGSRFGPFVFDRAAIDLALVGEQLHVRSLEIERGGGTLSLRGTLALDSLRVQEADLVAKELRLGEILEGSGLDLPIEGIVEARVTIRGSTGSGTLAIRSIAAFGETLDAVDARVSVEGDTFLFDELRATGPALALDGAARLDLAAGRFELQVHSARLQGAKLVALADSGFSGDVLLRGDLALAGQALAGELAIEGRDFRLRGAALGDSVGRIRLDASRAELELAGGAELAWAASGTLGFEPTLPIRLGLRLDEASVPSPDPRVPGAARISARAELAGPLAEPARLSLHGVIDSAEIDIAHERLSLVEPARFVFAAGELRSTPILLRGAGTDLDGRLRYSVATDALDASVQGTLDLGLVAAPFPELRAVGEVGVRLAVGGTWAAPSIEGSLETTDARLRLVGLRLDLDRIRFRVGLSETGVVLEEFSARAGNGEVSARGTAALDGAALGEFHVDVTGSNLRVSDGEGFRADLAAQLEVAGDASEATVSGRIDVLRALYDRDIALYDLIAARTREFEGKEPTVLDEWLGLDVRVVADNNLKVSNRLARLEASLDVQVGGTLGRPQLAGRATVAPGGQLLFREVRYRISTASVDFLERDRIDPYVTLEAETTVAEYTITLRIEGTAQHFDYTLTSDPALSTPAILALLTTGRVPEDPSALETGGELTAGYFGGILTQPVTRGIERLVGVDQIVVDPLTTQSGGDPTTRLTVSEEIADDVVFVFSTDIGQSERQLYRINWFPTPKLRLAAETDTLAGVGGEIGYFTRFGGRPRAATEPAGTDAPAAPQENARPIAAIRFAGVSAEVARELGPRLRIAPGDVYSRSAMFAGVEEIRRHFVERGRIECRVDAEAAEGPAGMEIVYTVEPGPRTEVTFSGVSARQARHLTARLEQLWVESVFPAELWADSADLIRRYFHDRGHYAVDVTYDAELAASERSVHFAVDPGKPVRIAEVIVRGGASIPEERVRRQLLSLPGGMLSKRPLVPAVLAADRLAVRELYREEGFLRAAVAEPRVALGLDGESARIEFVIDEGPRFLVSGVAVDGPGVEDGATLATASGLATGDVYSPGRVLAAEARILGALDELGHVDARVRSETALADTAASVRFHVDPGGRKRVAEIRVSGNRRTREHVIRRELTLRPGEILSREAILASQRALYRLGIFRNVRITHAALDGSSGEEQLVEVAVDEGPPFTTSVFGGYDTEARVKVGLTLADQNFLGRGQVLSLSSRWSSIERTVQLTASEPRLFGRHFEGIASIGWEEREEPEYSLDRSTLAFRVEKRLGPLWTSYARYGYQDVSTTEVEDPAEVAEEKLEDVRLGDLGGAVVRDSRDNPFGPSRGSYAFLGASVFSEPLLSERSFVKADAKLFRTWPLGAGHTFGSTARAGSALPFGVDERAVVPLSESFFLGGNSTLRGFSYDELGPGDSYFLINEELRLRIWKMLRAVLFYDGGNVYEEWNDLDPLDLRHVLGLGLRVETPIGPLRLEYGRKLDREDEETRGELFFAVGSTF